MANVRVFEADLSEVLPPIYAPLLRAKGLSGRAQTRVARKVRDELRLVLKNTLDRAYLDIGGPVRTGNSRRAMYGGIRAFGQNFATLRGHILGPAYIRAHEEGATIRPVRAKALAIPLPAALKADGTPKLPGPRSWQNVLRTFIYKSKRTGNAYIAYKNQGGTLTLLYVFVDQAVLDKHKGFISKGWDLAKPQLIEAMGQAMLFEMSRVNLGSLARVTTGGRGRR